jgi:hypothetical protein
MAAREGLTSDIDRIVSDFNSRRLDLPDGFFDRRTQFVINGAPFETLLGGSPGDPLILMLARGPAGFRFTAKALQHAIPDASTQVTPSSTESLSPGANAPNEYVCRVRLSGTLRGTGEAVDIVVPITLRLGAAGQVEVAEAAVEPAVLDKIRQARLLP